MRITLPTLWSGSSFSDCGLNEKKLVQIKLEDQERSRRSSIRGLNKENLCQPPSLAVGIVQGTETRVCGEDGIPQLQDRVYL